MENCNSTAKDLSAETIFNDMVYYDAKNLITVILFLEALMKLLLRLLKVVYSLRKVPQWRRTYLWQVSVRF